MSSGLLTIHLDAVVANWRALDAMSSCETAAVVKANGYGLGSVNVAKALYAAGARKFFVAVAREGADLREGVGPELDISVFSGHMKGDTDLIRDFNLTPMLNSVWQLTNHLETLPGHPFGIQLDSGMNRLGLEPDEWAAVSELALSKNPTLVMSHLACADEPEHPMNRQQLQAFKQMTDGISVPRSLAATGGILLGPEFHFDLTRPGIGLYGGAPFLQATPTIELDLPIIQVRDVKVGEAVGYGNKWLAERPSRIATVSCGYADGVMRCLSFKALLYHGAQPCKLVGRISMDLITVDITDLTGETPEKLNLIGPHQTVDDLATSAQTIGYEVLTQLGGRYSRLVNGGK